MKRLIIFLCCGWALLASAAEKPLELADVNGRKHTPLAPGEKRAAVLIFISRDCPISNAFVPEINRLTLAYGTNFAFYLVHADPDITAADAHKHSEVFAIVATVLLDPEQRLVKLTHAKVTPEAVVLARNGGLIYQGRINDLYASLTKKRAEPTQHDLRNALDALLAGKPVEVSTTKAIGCFIPATR